MIDDSEAIANGINQLVADRRHFYDNEQVSQFEVPADLIRDAHAIFEKDKKVSDFWKKKYQDEVVKNWDAFYKRNETNFFRDRMWLHKEFSELTGDDNDDDGDDDKRLVEVDLGQSIDGSSSDSTSNGGRPLLVDIGCGVGNALFPILFRNASLRAIGVDCSKRAIEFVNRRWEAIQSGSASALDLRKGRILPDAKDVKDRKQSVNEDAKENKNEDDASSESIETVPTESNRWPGGTLIGTEVWDITQNSLPPALVGCADFALLLFVLSAIPPHHFRHVAKQVAAILKPGAFLFFRDYGRYDMTQIRFAQSRRSFVDDNLYVRQDGTLAYFFLAEELRRLFVEEANLEEVEIKYFLREFTNRKTLKKMKRIWIQARFRKPETAARN